MEFKYFWPNFDTNNNIFTEMIKHYDIPLTSKITMISCFNNKTTLKYKTPDARYISKNFI